MIRADKSRPMVIRVRKQPAGFVGLVWQQRRPGGKMCDTFHETAPRPDYDSAEAFARSWCRTHGLRWMTTDTRPDAPEPACPFHSAGNEGRCNHCEDQ